MKHFIAVLAATILVSSCSRPPAPTKVDFDTVDPINVVPTQVAGGLTILQPDQAKHWSKIAIFENNAQMETNLWHYMVRNADHVTIYRSNGNCDDLVSIMVTENPQLKVTCQRSPSNFRGTKILFQKGEYGINKSFFN